MDGFEWAQTTAAVRDLLGPSSKRALSLQNRNLILLNCALVKVDLVLTLLNRAIAYQNRALVLFELNLTHDYCRLKCEISAGRS